MQQAIYLGIFLPRSPACACQHTTDLFPSLHHQNSLRLRKASTLKVCSGLLCLLLCFLADSNADATQNYITAHPGTELKFQNTVAIMPLEVPSFIAVVNPEYLWLSQVLNCLTS